MPNRDRKLHARERAARIREARAMLRGHACPYCFHVGSRLVPTVAGMYACRRCGSSFYSRGLNDLQDAYGNLFMADTPAVRA